jgi:hypothetical protein
MPLSALQRRVLAAIAAQRDPESYVAGGTAPHRHGTRGSADIGLFHDGEAALDRAVAADSAALLERGFDPTWERRSPAMYRALVADAGEATRLDWAIDSDFRFFPTMPDEEFGYLHPLDLATNKVLATAGQSEPRDAVDVLWIDRHIQPLGAIAWAAAEGSRMDARGPSWPRSAARPVTRTTTSSLSSSRSPCPRPG